uniref:CKLF-like MARVEL transmembrane domain containing 6 n=1 Tax=Xiphophorus couchianus TaxID=32473 RepID=A0A3B5MLI7_9TELE
MWSRVTTCLCFLFVSSAETFFTDPVICYFLDAFLMVYCIAATALFFREKVSFSKGGPHFRADEVKGRTCVSGDMKGERGEEEVLEKERDAMEESKGGRTKS